MMESIDTSTGSQKSVSQGAYHELFRSHERFLWGLCYRMTGSSADADDLVQETFARAIERPPARTDGAWRPWLTRVAVNLSRDLLRARKRRRYVGPWLPGPIETGDEAAPSPLDMALEPARSSEARYDQLESVTFAFLLALEALSPQQRAVLLLRDVFDFSAKETAETLGLTEANVRQTHLRARRAMEAYDRNRCIPTRALQDEAKQALEKLMMAMATGDMQQLVALLSDDVLSLSDGGGEFFAARVPLVGAAKVALVYTKLNQQRGLPTRLAVRMLNGMPALVTEFDDCPAGYASRIVLRFEFDDAGRVRESHSILASRKLAGVAPLERLC